MQLKQGKFCPLIKKDCIELQCSWFTQIRGKHPQTGQDVDEYGCAICWTPILLIENANQARQTSAAVHSFRNEMVKANETNVRGLAEAIQHDEPKPRRLIEVN